MTRLHQQSRSFARCECSASVRASKLLVRVEETLAHLRRNGGITLALRKLAVLEGLLIVNSDGPGPTLSHLRGSPLRRTSAS